MVRVRVRGDGVGMEAAHLAEVFQRGFSTKAHGSSGLSQDQCANAANALGGRLYAESERASRSACLHLILPGSGPSASTP